MERYTAAFTHPNQGPRFSVSPQRMIPTEVFSVRIPKNSGMPLSEPPELVDFDADTALDAGLEVAGPELLACIEYTHQDFHTLYVTERLADRYRDGDHLDERFEDVLAYCFIDFSERQLFEGKIEAAGRVQYFLTSMEHAFILRIFTESQGLFVILSPDAPVQETIDAMRGVMLDTDTIENSLYSP